MRRLQSLKKREKTSATRRSYLLVSMLLVGLAACAPVGPDFVKPDAPVNPDWLDSELEHFDTGPAELAEWWRTFNDPVLDRLIAMALENNNALKIAGLRVLESQARLGIAIGVQYPQIQVVAGDVTAVETSQRGINTENRDLTFVQYNLSAAASWELDFWGRFRRGVEAADAGLLATIADFDDLTVLLTAQVADIYVIIRSTEEQLRLAQESLEIQQRSYDIVQVLYENGDSSELDALQAKSLLLSTETVIPELEGTLEQTKYALSALLGLPPGDIEGVLQGDGSLPLVSGRVAIGIPADMLRQRPDVRRAEMLARAQNASVGIATANLYPSFSLSGTIGLSSVDNNDSTFSDSGGFSDLFDSDSATYAGGVSFVWPFLNYGRIRNNIRVEDARLQQALIAYQETVLQAAREAETAMSALRNTRAQDLILTEGVETAERSASLSLLRYQEGFADYQRVLSAQQTLFGQQQRYAANRGNAVRAVIAIYRSLGGGWQISRQFVDDENRQQMQERTNWGTLLEEAPER